jgi:hypothetical protein
VASELLKAQGISPAKPKQVLDLGQDNWLSFDMSDASDRFQVTRDTIAQRTRKISLVALDKT